MKDRKKKIAFANEKRIIIILYKNKSKTERHFME